MTPLTIKPLAESAKTCKMRKFEPEASSNTATTPENFPTHWLRLYSRNNRGTNNNRPLGWRKITCDKVRQVITLMVQAVLAITSLPLFKTAAGFIKEERKT